MMALVLAVVMVLAMGVTVFADPVEGGDGEGGDGGNTPATYSITINSSAKSAEAQTDTTSYTYYKIFDADIEDASKITVDPATGASTATESAVVYYVDSQAKATAVEGTGLFNVVKDATQNKWYVELKSDSTSADAIATALDGIKSNFTDVSDTFAQTRVGGAATADGLVPGYYLITSTAGSKLAVQTLADITINEKNTYPTVNKEVDETDESAQIGDTINYTLTVVIPATANDQIILTDTMTVGLTFGEVNSVTPSGEGATALDGTTAGQIYTVSGVTTSATGSSFTITFPAATVTANAGKTLTIDYTATLNEKAFVGSSASNEDGNDNTVKLNYGNHYESKPVTVETDTQSFTMDKIDGTNNEKLPGAEFELSIANVTGTGEEEVVTAGTAISLVEITKGEEYRIATTAEVTAKKDADDHPVVTKITTTGKTITVKGLDADVTYALTETKAPTGYNQLDDPTKVTPNTTNTFNAEIENNKGSVLPSTGGIGTTIFYIVGAILVIGAGVLRKRFIT